MAGHVTEGSGTRRRRPRSRNTSRDKVDSSECHGDSSSTEEGGDEITEGSPPASASPSPARLASGAEAVATTVKRRKKRKKPADDYDAFLGAKARDIQRVLHWASEEGAADVDGLRKFAISRAGLVSDDLRRQVWPLLVGLSPPSPDSPALRLASQEDCEKHPEYNQVVLDVNRSLKRFPPGIADEDRPELQDQGRKRERV